MAIREFEQLSDAVTELTDQPELTVIERRAAHRRRQRRALTATGAGVGVALAGALVWSLLPAAPAAPVNQPAATPSRQDLPAGSAEDPRITAADTNHLYKVEPVLTPGDRDGSLRRGDARLLGSDDGGRTWEVRQQEWNIGAYLVIRGPRALYVQQNDYNVARKWPAKFSTDGGRTWVELTTSRSPTSRVPADGWLECAPLSRPCQLRVVDPASRTIRPLAAPSAGFVPSSAQSLPGSAGIWVTGRDRSGTPAVMITRDGGATWATHAFNVAASGNLELATRDGLTIYALAGNHGFRSADGGRTWQPINRGQPLPGQLLPLTPGLVLPDGTLVIQLWVRADAQLTTLVSRDGGESFTQETPPHWPSAPVEVLSDGSYLSYGQGRLAAISLSADGKTWRQVGP